MLACRSFDDGMPMMGEFGPKIEASRINLAETADFDLGGLRVSPARREVSHEWSAPRARAEGGAGAGRARLGAAGRGFARSADRAMLGRADRRRRRAQPLHRGAAPSRQGILARAVRDRDRAAGRLFPGRAAGSRGRPRRRARSGRKVAIAALLASLLVAAAARASAGPASGASSPLPRRSRCCRSATFRAAIPISPKGIGEEILGQLAREPQFRVAGRASSSQFGNDPDIREVARRLDVDYVLEGSVRTQGDRVRVNAALVRASDGVRLWSDSYDGNARRHFRDPAADRARHRRRAQAQTGPGAGPFGPARHQRGCLQSLSYRARVDQDA